MMKRTFLIFLCCLMVTVIKAQSGKSGSRVGDSETISTERSIQSTPEKVLEEVFRAARTRDFSNLSQLCPTSRLNDGDTQEYICEVANGSEEAQEEFISYFSTARITGETVYYSDHLERKLAKIPFWFNHPLGEGRSREEMNFILIEGKWYLMSF